MAEHGMGYLPDPEGAEAFVSTLPHPTLASAGPDLRAAGEDVLLYPALLACMPTWRRGSQGNVGSCVGWGSSLAVDVLAARHGRAFTVVGGHEFFRQLDSHRSALLLAASEQDPTDRQRLLAIAIDLHRHLVRGATDASRADFDVRLHVFDGAVEDFDRIAT